MNGDHLKLPTLNKLLEENPLIKIFCNDEVGRKLIDNNIKCNILVHNKTFKLNIKGTQNKYELRPVNLFHDIDVKTYGMKLFIEDMFGNNTKIFYATDTGNVDGIIAKGYDYYFIEGNYDEDYLMDYEFRDDEFNRRFRTISFHLSKQEAHQFFIDNRKEDSELIILHKSQRFYR